MNGDVVPIFAVPLYKANIGLIETEKEYLMGDKSWVGGGTHLIQSQEDDILEKKECSRISKEIKYHLSHYLNTVISPKYEDVTLCITQSWINIITDGFHHIHRHAYLVRNVKNYYRFLHHRSALARALDYVVYLWF